MVFCLENHCFYHQSVLTSEENKAVLITLNNVFVMFVNSVSHAEGLMTGRS